MPSFAVNALRACAGTACVRTLALLLFFAAALFLAI
jgi:hypothetical protein